MAVVAAPRVPKQRQRSYNIREKIAAIRAAREVSVREAAKQCSVPRRTLRDWLAKTSEYEEFYGNLKKTTLGGQVRHEVMPFVQELATFMKDRRRNDMILATRYMIGFIKANYFEWIQIYLKEKKSEESGYAALMKLCQRLARFIDLESVKRNFSATFWNENSVLDPGGIINVDETGIYYDMPPKKIWNIVGEQPKVDVPQCHSARLTAVLGIKADGQKLPIMFIVKGTPGGYIKKKELLSYPKGHVYRVQVNAWMDTNGWQYYISKLLRYKSNGPSVLLVDNLDCHVSQASKDQVAEEACCFLVPLPINSTAVCQPLDVGVMGPLKAKLRAMWLTEEKEAKSAAKATHYDQKNDQSVGRARH
uniref:Uncharacterized protein AlNc14C2G219 n=1 Tax=Albugo laibachii Nc14 TaxID=890382 RepID=F0VZN6_9STRA|nr:conserved hypothetical protein [Albugo laibachii Nc14]|eukprot:CCA14108.1 conserved hypothetical protein [Albugo laibachii Nc14]